MRSILRSSVAFALLGLLFCAPVVVAQEEAANSDNPYDWIGHQHNEGLNAAIASRDQVGTSILPLALASVAVATEYGCGAANVRCINFSPSLSGAARAAAFPQTTRQMVVSQLNPVQADFFHQVMSVIDNYSNDPARAVAEMKVVENRILTSTLSPDQAMPLLMGASVGRYSVVYWNQQKADADSPWILVEGMDLPGAFGSPETIAAADAVGAIVGAGLALGSGVGAAAAGQAALVGALRGSLTAALMELWAYFF
jgi:hypothetical protein